MSDIIRLLPDSVANQIAAGEVIQRPASVVKELVENAVDSGASEISVNLKDAGRTLIQIIDNGCGMSVTDARMAFERHSTSKISKAQDLFAIQTMGFRGEALASIAAIAEVTLKTRRQEDEVGTQVDISGSEVKSQEPVSCPAGCNFQVKNLFFNVPARRKFLKGNSTELKHAINELMRIAIARPHIHFSLIHNGTDIYNLAETNVKQRIVALFGKAINQNLIPIQTETSIVNIKGFLGKPEAARKTFGEQFFFVNGRYMRHPYFHKAIIESYESVLPPETIPSYFIFFESGPERIDINIHPTKTEIKFEDERSVFQILLASTREALGKHNMVPSLDFDKEGIIDIPIFDKTKQAHNPEIELQSGFNPFRENYERPTVGSDFQNYQRARIPEWEELYKGIKDISGPASRANTDTNAEPGTGRFLQVRNKYIITAVKSGLMIVDQRRAHEKILFEKFMESINQQKGLSQKELYPTTLELNASDHTVLMEILDDLLELGFDIRDLGNYAIVIHGCPSDAIMSEPKEMIECLLEEYKQFQSDVKVKAKEKVAISLARASCIGYNKSLTDLEMRELVDNLFACSNPGQTALGKPVLTIFTTEEFEKKFN